VLTIAADTCRNCSLVYQNCNCRQFNPSYAHGRIPGLHYREDGPNSGPGSFPGAEGIGGGGGGMGSGGGANNSQLAGRVHGRSMDGWQELDVGQLLDLLEVGRLRGFYIFRP
jgi:hypothetical protein